MNVRAVAGAIVIAISIVACGNAATTTPAPTSSPAPTLTPTPSAVTATATATPIATPSTSATPTASVAASAAACAVVRQSGLLPSDRMTNVEIVPEAGRDVVRFSFGPRSLEPKGPARGTLDVAAPPFTGGASGLPIEIHGEHALQVVFTGMSLQNDVGQLAYDGPREFTVADESRSLRHLVLYDESEGQLGWYVGYDGPSCPTLTRHGNTVELALDFGPGA
ncbi:MAG: hypothetical protein ACJ769_09405 [Chloroflexota bacterium]